jgi:hypothetical protein
MIERIVSIRDERKEAPGRREMFNYFINVALICQNGTASTGTPIISD